MHMRTWNDLSKIKEKALFEAVRVTKPGGYILVSYCMNDPTVIHSA